MLRLRIPAGRATAPGRRTPLLLLLLVWLSLAGCENGEAEFSRTTQEAELEEAAGTAETADEQVAGTTPERIYYDLTTFEWYRRGEPLRIGQLSYLPEGRPVSMGEQPLDEIGEYQGVTYYAPEDAEEPYPVILVPVSPGYWQPFTVELHGPQQAES